MQLAEMGRVKMVSIPQLLKSSKAQAVVSAKSAVNSASVNTG